MAWWAYLLFRIPELVVVLVGLALALVQRRTLGGRAAGLASAGLAAMLVSMALAVTTTVLVFTDPGSVFSPLVWLQVVDLLLFAAGLGLVVAAVFVGRAPVPGTWRRSADNGQPPVAGGWTPPQQSQPADWRVMSGVWALPRERFDQPPS